MKVLLSAGMIQGGRSGVGRYVIALGEAIVREHPDVDLFIAGLDADRSLFPWLRDDRWVTIPARMSGGAMNLLWHQRSLNRLRTGYLRRAERSRKIPDKPENQGFEAIGRVAGPKIRI